MPHEEKSFLAWMREHKVFYTGEEYQLRFGIWMSKARRVREHRGSFKIGLNHLSCLTPAEYKSLLGFRGRIASNKAVKSQVGYDPTWDWRTKGVVNAIKDQGQCGSCWAFSAIQCAESADAIKTGKLQSYSESDLVDCVDSCYGCDGGNMEAAYDYVMQSQGGKFELESDYPYVPVTGTCKFDKSKGVGSISKYIAITQGDEDDLATKVQTYGPAAVAIDASHDSFQDYSSGIYDEPDCSSTNLDHGVGCLGWGSQSGQKYWIVRNSWGTIWGMQGYMNMIWKNNQCGIASMADVVIP
jgi:cathepsin L